MQISVCFVALVSVAGLVAAQISAPGLSPYEPVVGRCPITVPKIRASNGISASESNWIAARQSLARSSMTKWLTALDLSLTDLKNYQARNSKKSINVAVSGGGYRSLLIGAGVIEAIDSREAASNASLASGVSGFLQGTTYISGLSGGGWMLSSIVGNDWAKVSDLERNLWAQAFNDGLTVNRKNPAFLTQVTTDIAAKSTEFNVSINDPWGRLLSYQLLEGEDGGVSKTFSNYTNVPQFADHTMPFPILQALGMKPSDCNPGPNATQYEFTPYEFGSWDAGVRAFAPIRYVGTKFSNGAVVDSSKCVTGFDNSGFVLGTSSLIFPGIVGCSPLLGNNSIPAFAYLTAELMSQADVLVAGGTDGFDGLYPNPFQNLPIAYLVKDQAQLRLADGGLALQNNPLWSLIQPARNASLILTVDNSADILDANDKNFPNGSEILTTYVQSLSAGLPFPVIPPVATFLAQNLTKKPTLFGCANASVPTIVYLANAQHGSFPANQSTSTLMYTPDQSAAMIANGFNGMTQDKSTHWARCLGCFVVYDGKTPALRASQAISSSSQSSTTSAKGRSPLTTVTTTSTNGQKGRAPLTTKTGTTSVVPGRAPLATATSTTVVPMSAECSMCFDEFCYN